MNLVGIGEYLQEAGAGVVSRNIFSYNMPSKVEEGVLLRDRLQADKIDFELSGMMRGGFQMIVRSRTQLGAKNKAKSLIGILTLSDVQIADMKVKYIRPAREPLVFPVSDGDFVEALVIFDSYYSYTE